MATAVQRPLKGSRISTFYPVKNLPALSTLDSAFQLQEFISLTIRLNIHDVQAIVSIPDSRNNAEGGGSDDSTSALADEPDGDKEARNEFAVDEACWIYEQLRYACILRFDKLIRTWSMLPRRLAQDLSHPLITMLQQECTRATCPEMKAGEWMYLCVAHGNDGAMEVSRIPFIDERPSSDGRCSNAAPSTTFYTPWTVQLRFSIHHERSLHGMCHMSIRLTFSACFETSLRRINIPAPSHRHFGSLARRLGRIFAHAYFHHREVFEQAEAESSLYARFLALTFKFDLVPAEFLIIPTQSGMSDEPEPPRLLAAAVDPMHQSGSDDENDDRGRGTHRGLGMDILGGIDRNPSPRKGRNRTGTMIFSEALIMADELSKGGSPSPERGSGVQMPTASTEMHESESDFVHVDVSSHEEKEEEHHDEDGHEGHLDLPGEKKKSDFGMRAPLPDEEEEDEKSDFGLRDPLSDEEEEDKSDFGMRDPLSDSDEEEEKSDFGMRDRVSPVSDEEEDEGEDEDEGEGEGEGEGEKSEFGMDDPLEEDEEHVLAVSEMHAHVEAIQDHNAPEQDVTDDAEDSVAEDADEVPEHEVTSAHKTSTTTIIELPPAEEADAQEEDLTEAVVEPQYEEDDSADAQEVAEQIALNEPHDQPAAT